MKNKKRNKSTQNNFHTKQKETYFKNDKAINTNTLKNHCTNFEYCEISYLGVEKELKSETNTIR